MNLTACLWRLLKVSSGCPLCEVEGTVSLLCIWDFDERREMSANRRVNNRVHVYRTAMSFHLIKSNYLSSGRQLYFS